LFGSRHSAVGVNPPATLFTPSLGTPETGLGVILSLWAMGDFSAAIFWMGESPDAWGMRERRERCPRIPPVRALPALQAIRVDGR